MQRLLLVATFVCASISAASADEGMWTYDNFPSAKVSGAYGFAPSAAFLDHVRKSSVRIAAGCSASFISPQGLVMTNHHCVVECVGQISTARQNYVPLGFYAKMQSDEKACPNFELDQLTGIQDITTAITGATADKSGDAAQKALHAAEATAQQSCGKDPAVRCDVVSLYHGGLYDLYRYKKYTDVRLVFAPEDAIAQFGGDPDNFNFPRYDFDIGVLRAYESGKPAATPDYLKWSRAGSNAGDLVFVSGNPGATQRELTVAQLAYTRDIGFPFILPFLAEMRGVLEEFQQKGPEQTREVHETLFYLENSFKALLGEQKALDDSVFFASKVAQEQALRAKVAANPHLQAAYGSAWEEIASLQTLRRQLAPAYNLFGLLENDGKLFGDAQTLVEAAAERKKPNGERLPEYTDQGLAEVEGQLTADASIYPDYEEASLSLTLTEMRRVLGTDDPLVKSMLGNESPEALAHRLVSGSKLSDVAVREALFKGGEAAIAASNDPMIEFAERIDPQYRSIRSAFEARIEAPTRAAAERIAKARFAIYGTRVDPDATFTLRLSYGAVKGFDANGVAVAPYTTMHGLYERASGAAPYALPERWLGAEASIDGTTPMNLSTTNDIIGGNSGSPLIDKNAEVVGLIFDGNIYSLGGDFGYEPLRNRAVAVDSRALLTGLDKVYHANRLVTEIDAAAK